MQITNVRGRYKKGLKKNIEMENQLNQFLRTDWSTFSFMFRFYRSVTLKAGTERLIKSALFPSKRQCLLIPLLHLIPLLAAKMTSFHAEILFFCTEKEPQKPIQKMAKWVVFLWKLPSTCHVNSYTFQVKKTAKNHIIGLPREEAEMGFWRNGIKGEILKNSST